MSAANPAFTSYLEQLQLTLPESFTDEIDHFYQLLTEANKTHNLTRIISEEDFLIKHVIDSLLLLKIEPLDQPARILDIGCGGGIPGLILKLARPEISLTALDRSGKKVNCVNHFIAELKLDKCRAIHANAREIARKPEHKKAYDLVTARAVGKSTLLISECYEFCSRSGRFIFYKTPGQITEDTDSLRNECKQYRLKPSASEVMELPEKMGSRQFWIIESS